MRRAGEGLAGLSSSVKATTCHGLLVEKPDLCNLIITEFLTTDPVTTFAPIRRATSTTT